MREGQKKVGIILSGLTVGVCLIAAAVIWARGARERAAKAETARHVLAAKALVRQRLSNSDKATFWNVRAGYGEVCGYVRIKDNPDRESPYTHFRVVEGRAELRSDFENRPIEIYDRWDKALTNCILMGEPVPDET